MPIGTGIIYNVGDLILSQVSGSGTAFLETKIAAATSSIIYFDSTARINSASLNSITVGTASYVSGSTSIITNLTASNISASGTISASLFVGSHTGSTFGTSSWAINALTASYISPSGNAFVQGGNSFGTTALLGTNDAQSLALETNGTTRMSINSNGNVAINTSTSGLYRLNIADTHRGSATSASLNIETTQNQNQGLATTSNDSGINNAYYVNNFTSSTAIQNQAIYNQTIIAGSGSFSGSYRASRNAILLSNTASLDINGNIINTWLTNQISSNIPNFNIPNWTAGTSTYVDLVTGNSTGSITNLYQHQIGSPFPSGGAGGITVTNSYGVYIAKQKTTNIVTNGWGIYQVDTGDLNIFAGKTRIGSTTVPVNALDVTGNISASVVTASLFFGTSSWASNALTASFLPVGTYNITSSWSTNALTASSLVAANSYTITNLTASNISASLTGSFGIVGIGTVNPAYKLDVVSPDVVVTGQPGIISRFSSGVDGRSLIRVVNTSNNNTAQAVHAGISFVAYATSSNQPSTNTHEAQIMLSNGTTGGTNDLKFIAPQGMTFWVSSSNVIMTGSGYVNYGTQAIAITPGGFVGIGTASPGAKLDVNGDVYVSPNTAGKNTFILSTNASNDARLLMRSDVTTKVDIQANGTSYFNGGNVGIGTTSATTKLHVSGSVTALDGRFISNVTSGTDKYFLDCYGTSTNQIFALYENNNTAYLNSYSSMAFRANQNGGSGGYFVFSGANVGIGTTIPAYKLDVIGPATSNGVTLRLSDAASLANSRHILLTRGSVSGSIGIAGSQTEDPLWLSRSSGYDLIVASSGNIGIGTSIPGALLEISSSTAASLLNVKGAGGNGILFVSGSGNVGIGTTSPGTKLEVSGSIRGGSFPVLVTNTGEAWFGRGSDRTLGTYTLQLGGSSATGTKFEIVDRAWTKVIASISGEAPVDSFLINSSGNVGIGAGVPASKLQVNGNISGSSFTSSISNAVGFLGTSSWASNVVSASYAVSSSFATTAQTANALNAANTYTIAGLTSAYVDVNGSGTIPTTGIYRPSTKTLGLSADGTLIFKISNVSAPATSSIETGNFVVQSGNFGLGTNSPNNKLDIFGATGTTLNMSNVDDGSRGGKLTFISSSATGRQFYVGTNSSIYNLVFGIDSIEKARIDTNGNLGIGTTAPAYLLDVSGSSRHGYRTADNHYFTGSVNISGSLNATASWATNALTASYLVPTNSYTITNLTASNISASGTGSFGIVGIGTTSPTSKLNVVETTATGSRIQLGTSSENALMNSGSTNDLLILNAPYGVNSATTSNLGAKWGIKFVGSLEAGQINTIGKTSAIYAVSEDVLGYNRGTSLAFYTNQFNDIPYAERMRIYHNGNIGIGTTSPGYKLTIQNDAASTNALLALQNLTASATTNHGVSILPILSDNTGSVAITAGGLYWLKEQQWTNDTTSRDSYLRIDTTENNSASEKVRITSAGNVGIGTSTVSTKLAVEGGSVSTVNVTGSDVKYSFDIRTLVGGAIGFNNAAASNVYGAVTGSAYFGVAQSYPIVFTTAGAERMRLDSTGGINIGTPSQLNSSRVSIADSAVKTSAGNCLTFATATGGSNDFQLIISRGSSTSGYYAFQAVEQGIGYKNIVFNQDGGNVGIGVTSPVAKLQVAGNVSGSSFTSSISNAVGFLGTSSWAQNVVSASYATTAQTANALNTGNSYTISGLTNNSTLSQQGTLSMGSGYQILATTGTVTNPGVSFVADTNTGFYTPSADNIGIVTNGSEKVRIDSSGNVGVGSSSPSSKFEVLTSAVGLANQPNIIGNFRGDTDGRSLIRVDNTSTSAGAAALQAGISFVAYSNVSSQPSANKHEAQIILGSTGATSVTGGQTGTLQIVAPQDIAFNVSASNTIMTGSNYTAFGSNAMYITRLGSVGIGTTVPSARLHVTGSTGGIFEVDTAGGATTFYVSASGNVGIGTANATDKLTLYGALASYKTGADTIQTQVYLANTGNTRAFNLQLNSGGTGLDLWSYNSANAWLRHTTFDYNGSVGIGTATSILGKLQLDSGVAPYYGPATGSATPNGMFTLGSVTGDVVNTFGVDASATAYAWIQPRKITVASYSNLVLNPNGGNVGIGTVTPAAKLEITGSSNSALLNIKSPISGAILYVSGSGAVGIGTSNVGAFTLQVSGSFGATTKSFIIDHPTKAGKKLMYGSLESPYHGIRLTGRDTLKEGKCKIQLPDYIYKLILHDSINIQLTGIKCNKTLYVDDINIPENYFTIAYDKAIFESYKDYEFFWDFTAIRADVPELTTEL